MGLPGASCPSMYSRRFAMASTQRYGSSITASAYFAKRYKVEKWKCLEVTKSGLVVIDPFNHLTFQPFNFVKAHATISSNTAAILLSGKVVMPSPDTILITG